MKTPQEILRKTAYDNEGVFLGRDLIIKAMQEYADQEKRKAFNEALDLAANKITPCSCCSCSHAYYEKESILSLKIK